MKKGFLKEVIYRLDYLYLPTNVFENLYNHLFSIFNSKLQNIRADYAEPNSLNNDNQVRDRCYSMSSLDEREVLKISRNCIIFDFKLKQDNSEQYNSWVDKVIEYVNKNKNAFIIKRIGIRKNNCFYIENEYLDQLNDIFNKDFSYHSSEDMNIYSMDNRQIFEKENAFLGFYSKIGTGILSEESLGVKNKKANLVQFDFDYYSTNKNCIEECLSNPSNFLLQVQSIILKCFLNIVNKNALKYIDNKKDMYEKYHAILID